MADEREAPMDNSAQVIASLGELRSLLETLVTIGIVIAVAVSIRTLLVVYTTLRNIRKEGFEDEASALYKNGKLDELITLCRERILVHPGDRYAHFYLGLAEFDREHFVEARVHFEKTLALSPAWRTHVEHYLERMREQASPEASPERTDGS